MERVEFVTKTQEISAEEKGALTCLTDYQRASLAMFESDFMNDENDHPWWPFFNGGVRDETGAIWTVYNRWFDETRPDGWKIAYCPPEEEFFTEIQVNDVLRSTIFAAQGDQEGLVTFQLHIRDEALGLLNNDVLNLLLRYNQRGISQATLHMWNQRHAMTPLNDQLQDIR